MEAINILVAFGLVTVGVWIGFGFAALCVAAKDTDLRGSDGSPYDEEYEGDD